MPKSIVKRAGDILKQLEKDNRQQGIAAKPMVEVGETRGGMQLSFFQLDDPVLCQIRDEILNLDVNNLGCYCNAFSYYISVTKQLKKENKVIKKPTQNGEILVKNPLCDLQKMYSEEMRKFASMCGLTIDSRLKAATIAREGIDNEINDEFGDI